MGLLSLALKAKRWDLAAHTIVLATARKLERERHQGRQDGRKERRAKK